MGVTSKVEFINASNVLLIIEIKNIHAITYHRFVLVDIEKTKKIQTNIIVYRLILFVIRVTEKAHIILI